METNIHRIYPITSYKPQKMETNILEIYPLIKYNAYSIEELVIKGILQHSTKRLIACINQYPTVRFTAIIMDSTGFREYFLIPKDNGKDVIEDLTTLNIELGDKVGEVEGNLRALDKLPQILGQVQSF